VAAPAPRRQILPAIILIEPQLGENIGAAARAMANFGLTDLRLVAPRDGWPSDKARASASGADGVIDATRLYATAEDAVADLGVVYATTARRRDLPKTVIGPREAASALHSGAESGVASGVMFGRERWGLTNEEVALADAIVTFPVTHAVLLLSYECMAADLDGRVSARTDMPQLDFTPAPKEHLLGLTRHLETALEQTGYFRTADMKPTMVQNLRAILQRAKLTADEIDVLHGVVGALERAREDGDAGR